MIVAVVAAALCAVLVVLLVWRPFDHRPPIETQALGVWQEATTSQPVRLTVSAAGDDSAATQYWVTYRPSSEGPFPRNAGWGQDPRLGREHQGRASG